jgi:hypothetical protein
MLLVGTSTSPSCVRVLGVAQGACSHRVFLSLALTRGACLQGAAGIGLAAMVLVGHADVQQVLTVLLLATFLVTADQVRQWVRWSWVSDGASTMYALFYWGHCCCQGQNVVDMQSQNTVTMYCMGVTSPKAWPYLSLNKDTGVDSLGPWRLVEPWHLCSSRVV